MRIRLNSYPPFDEQVRVLGAIKSKIGSKGIHRFHAVAGRGGAKTAIGVLAVFESMVTFNRGLAHLWTEQDYPDCRDVFLPVWEAFIPEHLYSINRQTLTITLDRRIGGARLDVRTRFARGQKKEKRGPTYAGAVTDEAAQDPQDSQFRLITKMLREEKAAVRWHLVTTTPRPGWYNELVRTTDEPVFRWSSWANPYVSKETFDDFAKDMSDEELRQEMNAELISLSGLVWSEYVDEDWPRGNRHAHEWTKGRPFQVWCDLGNRSAWLIVQEIPRAQGSPLFVIVAEYQPDDGDTAHMIERIRKDYGTPSRVCCGSDVSSDNTVTGTPHTVLFRASWPSARISWPTGDNVSKSRQVWHTKALLAHPHSGERTILVSRGLVSHDARKRRGILEMFATDTWPKAGEPGGDGLLRKDKSQNPQSVEDTRDALMYGAVCAHHPRVADPAWRTR